jgi:hypothetical protein
MHRRVPLVVGAALALVSRDGSAQSKQPYSVQASVLATAINFNDRNVGGVGVEAQVRANRLAVSPRGILSAGLGVQATSHSSGSQRVDLRGVFFEPRYAFVLQSDRWFPYVAARLAVLRQSGNFATASNGFGAGAGGGVVVALSPRVNLDFGGAAIRQSFGDVTRTGSGQGIPARFEPFFGYALKAGVNLGLGGGGS